MKVYRAGKPLSRPIGRDKSVGGEILRTKLPSNNKIVHDGRIFTQYSLGLGK